MQRVRADFNTMNAYVGKNDHLADERRRVWLNPRPYLRPGLRVTLYQDEDDFEVEGVVQHDEEFGDQGWYALIDWSTRRDL